MFGRMPAKPPLLGGSALNRCRMTYDLKLASSNKLSFNEAKGHLESGFYTEFSRIEQAGIVGHFQRRGRTA
jgi:hypothetical protein